MPPSVRRGRPVHPAARRRLLGDSLSSFAGLLEDERPDVVLLVHRQLARRRRAELEAGACCARPASAPLRA
jgi:hypothetical protein